MTEEERARLIEFLGKKLCAPCRRDEATADHPACKEAEELIEIVKRA